jgi:hypothetical protein
MTAEETLHLPSFQRTIKHCLLHIASPVAGWYLWSPTGKPVAPYLTPQWGDIPAKCWRIHPRPKAVASCSRGESLQKSNFLFYNRNLSQLSIKIFPFVCFPNHLKRTLKIFYTTDKNLPLFKENS